MPLALAEFVKRPQAERQIGAETIRSQCAAARQQCDQIVDFGLSKRKHAARTPVANSNSPDSIEPALKLIEVLRRTFAKHYPLLRIEKIG
ncbi:MAG: hypothetical protein IPJ97_05935 [Proteobacteria bacterium]|nr:hypothetical protein [Pseudomonadota bacterium]